MAGRTYRFFLICAIAFAAFPARPLLASPVESFYVVQLSDTHIIAGDAGQSRARLEQAVAEVNSLNPQPAFILFTGDLVSNGDEASYLNFAQIAARLKSKVYFIPGNHDDAALMRKILASSADVSEWHQSFVTGGIRFILLDSQRLSVETDSAERRWLEETLNGSVAAPTVVVLHHNLLRIETVSAEMNHRSEILSLIESHSNVRLIINGHTHFTRLQEHEGRHFVNCRSTAYSREGPPGYCIYTFDSSGKVTLFDKPLGEAAQTTQIPLN